MQAHAHDVSKFATSTLRLYKLTKHTITYKKLAP